MPYDDHDSYEAFVTREANANFEAIKKALAAGDEPDIEAAIAALIWKEAERRAEAAAAQRELDGAAEHADNIAWEDFVAREPAYG